MTAFNVRTTNLKAINSMTKYPSIPTYHNLDPRDGGLLDETVPFTGPVIGTEKIDGTNSRIILLPDGTYLLGSREELLYAQGDLIGNPALGIIDALRPIADNLANTENGQIVVHYLEDDHSQVRAVEASRCAGIGRRGGTSAVEPGGDVGVCGAVERKRSLGESDAHFVEGGEGLPD